MKISEVVELPSGSITFKAELNPEQVTAMVRWFITMMMKSGAVKLHEDSTKEPIEVNPSQLEFDFGNYRH